MSTSFAQSEDGLEWRIHGDVLTPTPGSWDARGTRLTAILSHDPLIAFYDGRATAAENWHERTGVATSTDHGLSAQRPERVAESPFGDHALRYVAALRVAGRIERYYFEACRQDGAHDLYTQEVESSV